MTTLLHDAALAASTGVMSPDLLAVTSGPGDIIYSAAEQSWSADDLAALAISLEIIGVSGPYDVVYSLLESYAPWYDEYARYLLTQAVSLHASGRYGTQEAADLRAFLDDAEREQVARGSTAFLPLHVANNLLSTDKSVRAASSALCTLAKFDDNAYYPFPEHLAAAAIKAMLPAPTTADLYAAANATFQTADRALSHSARVNPTRKTRKTRRARKPSRGKARRR